MLVCLILGTAVCFAISGALQAQVVARKLPVGVFFAIGSALAAVVAWTAWLDRSALAQESRVGALAVWMGLAGATNVCGHLCMARALAGGRRSVAWAIGQSALAIPLVASLVIWDERAGIWGWSGLGLLLGGMVLLARSRTDGQGPTRIGWALGAFLCYGTTQLIMAVPSHWPGWSDPAHLRLPLNLTANALAAAVAATSAGIGVGRRILPWSMAYALVLCTAFILVFAALDRLAARGASGVLFPLACGGAIVLFTAWNHVAHRERLSAAEAAGMGLAVAGILALVLRVV